MSDCNVTLKDGREMYMPQWGVFVAHENLGKLNEVFNQESLAEIILGERPLAAFVRATMNNKDPQEAASLTRYVVSQARIDGKKVSTFVDDLTLELCAEIFTEILKSQYKSFLEYGLAEASSQDS